MKDHLALPISCAATAPCGMPLQKSQHPERVKVTKVDPLSADTFAVTIR